MVSFVKCLVALFLLAVPACLGQAPMSNMFFPGQPPMGAAGAPNGAGGPFSNPMMLPLAFSGLDWNKILLMSMMGNGMGGGGAGAGGLGTMLPMFGLYNAFN